MATTETGGRGATERETRPLFEDACDVAESLSPMRLLPREARQHVRAAQREVLLAVRSVIDATIERLETTERRHDRRATRIEVK